jgi:hypothetical protein
MIKLDQEVFPNETPGAAMAAEIVGYDLRRLLVIEQYRSMDNVIAPVAEAIDFLEKRQQIALRPRWQLRPNERLRCSDGRDQERSLQTVIS